MRLPFVIKIFFRLFLSGCFTQVLLYIHTLCMPAKKALVSLCINCEGSPEPLLLDNAIGAKSHELAHMSRKIF